MFILCTIAGILCLLYFILLLIYSGLTSMFYLIWPFMSAGFLFIGWLFRIKFFQRLPAPGKAGLLLLLSLSLAFFLGVEGMILKGAFTMPTDAPDYLIVLGAHVRPSGPSRALALRLDKAYEYALQHPDTVIIVSGGQGDNEPCTESLAMKRFLIAKGLPQERILEESRSANTRQNLLFSQALIPDFENASVGIVSNGFHICRALHLAKALGYRRVSGIPAKSDLITQPANLLREFFAVVKDFWLLR